MRMVQMLAMAAFCVTAATGWARTMSVTSFADRAVTLTFGEPSTASYTLCVAYGNTKGGENKYKWASFIRNVATIEPNQTTYTYQFPADFTPGMFYRFFLLQTENLPYDRELEYIESTSTAYGGSKGTQFIDTGIEGRLGLKMETNFVWLEGGDSTILGARNVNNRFYGAYMYRWTPSGMPKVLTWTYGLGDEWKKWEKGAYANTPGHAFHVICEMKTNIRRLVVNDSEIYSYTSAKGVDDYATDLNLYVFGCNWDGEPKLCVKARLFDMKIWKDDGLVRNYRPVALANGDGALYDEVTDAVFPNGSSTPFILGELQGEENRRGIVRAMSQELEVLTEEERRIALTSYWVGGVDGDLAKDANWRSYNRNGEEVAVAPVSTTEVHFNGMVNASWASASDTLGAAKIVCEGVHLAGNCDWRALGSAPFEGNLNLNGWKLQLAGLTGTGAITDRPFAVAGYEALDYIEATDFNTYINTGVIGASGATVEIDVMGITGSGINGASSWGYGVCVVGCKAGDVRFYPFYSRVRKIALGYNELKNGSADSFMEYKRYVGYNCMRNDSQNTFWNGLLACNFTIAGEYDTKLPMYIFAMNQDGKAIERSNARLYSARFWTGGGAQMARDFVPARRTQDGALGLYDKAGNMFYGQEVADGKYSEPFTAGPAVAASGTSGELWVEVAQGVTNVNAGVVIAGSTKLVKSGKGVYRTTVLNQTYTGGTRVADGIFDQGVTSANDSMPMGQNEVTVVFEKEADVEWGDGCYFSWEDTKPANTTFSLSPATRSKGFIMIEQPDGIYIKKPRFYIFMR